MFNISGNLEALFKLPLKIMVALCISSGIILFLPNSVVEKMYMSNFRDNFGFILGLVFVISLSIIVCSIIVNSFKIMAAKNLAKRANAGRLKFIENLDEKERELIKEMYRIPDKTLELPHNSGTIIKLRTYGVITPVSNTFLVDLFDPQVTYFLQPWVCKYIEEHKDF